MVSNSNIEIRNPKQIQNQKFKNKKAPTVCGWWEPLGSDKAENYRSGVAKGNETEVWRPVAGKPGEAQVAPDVIIIAQMRNNAAERTPPRRTKRSNRELFLKFSVGGAKGEQVLDPSGTKTLLFHLINSIL